MCPLTKYIYIYINLKFITGLWISWSFRETSLNYNGGQAECRTSSKSLLKWEEKKNPKKTKNALCKSCVSINTSCKSFLSGFFLQLISLLVSPPFIPLLFLIAFMKWNTITYSSPKKTYRLSTLKKTQYVEKVTLKNGNLALWFPTLKNKH